ncbi:MAG: hypothetical protein ACRDT2_10240, partial [Natronosporangium sp.]
APAAPPPRPEPGPVEPGGFGDPATAATEPISPAPGGGYASRPASEDSTIVLPLSRVSWSQPTHHHPGNGSGEPGRNG